LAHYRGALNRFAVRLGSPRRDLGKPLGLLFYDIAKAAINRMAFVPGKSASLA